MVCNGGWHEAMFASSIFIAMETIKNINNREIQFNEREVQILNLVVEGFNNSEIAGILFLHESTIEYYRRNMLKKACDKKMLSLVRIILKAEWVK